MRDGTPLIKDRRVMGIDELNLAEFPLSVLSDRTRPGQKTLVFEDEIDDRGKQQRITRRLTITGSDEYGLPTAMDDDVILGLAQVTNAADNVQRQVNFSRYELIRTLGWRHEGKSYRRLETSLHRWLGVTLQYANAWWDRAADCWVSESFHILDNVRLVHGPQKRGGQRNQQAGVESFIVWNDVIFRNLRDGHLKQLDMEFYRQLSGAVAKRMFRFLDKRFYQSPRWTFELKRFAYEHIGLSRCYGCAELKRLLSPAILELEHLGYLTPLDRTSRFRKLRRGHWEVLFHRARKRERDASPMNRSSEGLVARGVKRRFAQKLVQEYSEETVRKSIVCFDKLMNQPGSRSLENPPGLLVHTIRNAGRTTSAGPVRTPTTSVRVATAGNAGSEATAASCWPAKEPSEARKARAEVRKYLKSLTEEEHQRLKEEACSSASRVCREGFERARGQGNETRAAAYVESMICAHIQRKLKAADK